VDQCLTDISKANYNLCLVKCRRNLSLNIYRSKYVPIEGHTLHHSALTLAVVHLNSSMRQNPLFKGITQAVVRR
jgi:hypothetical protein